MLRHIALYRFKESLIYIEVSQNERRRMFSSHWIPTEDMVWGSWQRTRWHKIPLCILISFYPQLCQCWLKCNHEKCSHILARLEATHWVQHDIHSPRLAWISGPLRVHTACSKTQFLLNWHYYWRVSQFSKWSVIASEYSSSWNMHSCLKHIWVHYIQCHANKLMEHSPSHKF